MDQFLIIMDMQNDFITGSLGTDQARSIVSGVAQRIRAARESQSEVWFTMDTHDDGYLDTQEGENLPILHCLKGTDGWQLAEDIAREKTQAMRVFEKHAFGAPAFVKALDEHAQKQGHREGRGLHVELCGLCTDICVITNALLLKAALPEARVAVQAHLCAGLTRERHLAALEVMRSCQIAVRA